MWLCLVYKKVMAIKWAIIELIAYVVQIYIKKTRGIRTCSYFDDIW